MFSFFRVLKFSLQDFFRNFSLSIMTILILILMLLSINILVTIRALTEKAVAEVKDQIDVSVYFRPDATSEQVNEVKNHLQSFPEVVTSTFLSQAEVLEQFKKTHSQNQQILSSLEELGENPLGPTLMVKTRDPKDYKKIFSALDVPEYKKVIEDKTFATTENTIDRIRIITTNVQKFVLFLGILFGVIAILVVFNTMRIAIYTHRIEISIKKLVGATNWFIRGPYFIQGLFFSLISILITAGIIFSSSGFIDPYIRVVFGESQFLTNYFSSHILFVFGIEFLAVLVLTLLTTDLAMRKYLKV